MTPHLHVHRVPGCALCAPVPVLDTGPWCRSCQVHRAATVGGLCPSCRDAEAGR